LHASGHFHIARRYVQRMGASIRCAHWAGAGMLGACVCLLAPTGGCSMNTQKPDAPSLERAWRTWSEPAASESSISKLEPSTVGNPGVASPTSLNVADSADPTTPDQDAAIAYVNGEPIDRRRLISLLLKGHGSGILEQLVVLTAAEQEAKTRGLSVTDEDVQREYESSLRALMSGARTRNEDDPLDREAAEALLNDVLARRNISRTEYMLGMRRNAYLRALILANMNFSDEALDSEYNRAAGREYTIRHIQLASLSEATRVQEKLAGGADFAELARQFSVNRRTGADGGRLEPFTTNDRNVPGAVRRLVTRMEPGDVSNPVRTPEGYQIIKLVHRRDRPLAAVRQSREQVEKRLRERITKPAMQALYQSLFARADIRINDPVLQEAFERKHGERRDLAAGSNAP